MKRKIRVKYLLLVIIALTIMNIPNIVSAESLVECKPGTTAWTNISVSDAYDRCREMTNIESSIGVGELNPHLTTNRDFNAVALLAGSEYGFGLGNNNSNTTGNESGVMNLSRTFTASILQEAVGNVGNYGHRKSLINNVNTNFVEIINSGYEDFAGWNRRSIINSATNLDAHKGMGIIETEIPKGKRTPMNGTSWGNPSNGGWVSEFCNIYRYDWFQFVVGNDYGFSGMGAGAANAQVTFRPVLWND